jgi:membrane peptidoglycan carboxypeptidase
MLGSRWKCWVLGVLAVTGGVSAGLLVFELRTSWYQSQYLSRTVQEMRFWMEPGPSSSIRFPKTGHYDLRLGYVQLPAFIDSARSKGYQVQAQARISPRLAEFVDRGFFSTYREKTQAGLRVLDRDDRLLFSALYPERVYSSFGAIPEILVRTLLYIENRELLESGFPYRNPAVEWDRLADAAMRAGLRVVDRSRKVPGGSTLATQIEKYRHSPGGFTPSIKEKFRQMVSASLRSYLEGRETMEARRRIILDYINSMPLAAVAGYGEVTGLGDGLWAWYGADLDKASQRLATHPAAREQDLAAWAAVYKQALSLTLAQRRPSFYLLDDRGALEDRVRSYLRLLGDQGVLTPAEEKAATQARPELRRGKPVQDQVSFVDYKAANAIRPRLLPFLGVSQLYELDRLDLTVQSTIDSRVQEDITGMLERLRDPGYAEAAGLFGFRLLERGDPSRVIYSFTLYERNGSANLLRVQTDNFNQPLNINEGIKLELGSSAKLRTLVTYLEVIDELHQRYAGRPVGELRAIAVPRADRLTQWGLSYLASAADTSLSAMLEASMSRPYPANPHEQFFTGGGLHTFANFDPEDDDRELAVRDAVYKSVNLVFIRLMRDIVRYYVYQREEPIAEMLEDRSSPQRQVFLSRFADQEGRKFLSRFYRDYQDKSAPEVLEDLAQEVSPRPVHLAVVFRSVVPDATQHEFGSFMRAHLPNSALSEATLRSLYERYSMQAYSLMDRGYLARLHPLKLWLVGYLYQHPKAPLAEVAKASAAQRQEVYTWLFKTPDKGSQDSRIRTTLEVEAFQDIHRAWKRLGYPFGSLVPSYATAIGSSADRPAALAELMGIILSNGVWYPSLRVQELHFAKDTPYETVLRREARAGEQVLAPEIAAVVRKVLVGVVEQGTARRVYGAFVSPGGPPLAVGGKTGTGDNRYEVFNATGQLLQSRVVNRTATFAFMIGARFFGVVTAYVAGQEAGGYKFTSALPVQVLKVLAPKLMPLVERAEGAG